jgi:hypothetical protein
VPPAWRGIIWCRWNPVSNNGFFIIVLFSGNLVLWIVCPFPLALLEFRLPHLTSKRTHTLLTGPVVPGFG